MATATRAGELGNLYIHTVVKQIADRPRFVFEEEYEQRDTIPGETADYSPNLILSDAFLDRFWSHKTGQYAKSVGR